MKQIKKCFIIVCLYFILFLPYISYAKDSLIYLRATDSTSLDPGKSTDIYSSEVIFNIFEGLVRFKKGSFEIEPCLAKKWEVKENGKKWIFFLRTGVTFHNGKDFDSNSVILSFKRRIERRETEVKEWRFFFPYIKNIKALDKFTVEITLNKPYAPLLTALTDTTALIVASESYKDSNFVPVGTGPFEFEKWEKGKYLVIKRNAQYWGEQVLLPRIVFKTISNPATRTLQIKNRDADISRIESAREYDEFLGNKEIKIITRPSLIIHYLAFNTRKFPFTKVEVKRAMAHLINKRGIVKHTFQNLALPAVTPIPPELFGFNRNISDFRYDLKKAANLLRRAGLEKGFTCKLYFSEKNIALQKIVNIISQNARRVNITIKKVPLPFQELVKRCDRGEHDMVILGWTSGPDPDFFLYPLFTLTKGNINRAFYENPELTNLLEKARSTLNQEKRIQYYEQAQFIIHKDLPWIPLFHLKSMAVHHKNIKNIYFNPNYYLIFRKVVKTNED